MRTTADHRRYAQECVARAQRAEGESDKALWLTLAQSWVQLAEQVARSASQLGGDTEKMSEALPADRD